MYFMSNDTIERLLLEPFIFQLPAINKFLFLLISKTYKIKPIISIYIKISS